MQKTNERLAHNRENLDQLISNRKSLESDLKEEEEDRVRLSDMLEAEKAQGYEHHAEIQRLLQQEKERDREKSLLQNRIEDMGLIAAVNAVYPEAVPVDKKPSIFDPA